MQPKAGGKLHLRLNTGTRPIVNKYRKGKLKRTLKRVQEGVKPLRGKRVGSAQSARRIQPGGGSGRAGGPADLSRSPCLPAPPPALRPRPLAASAAGGVAGVGGRGRGWGRRGTAPRSASTAAAGRISTAAVRRDRLRDGWEGRWGRWLGGPRRPLPPSSPEGEGGARGGPTAPSVTAPRQQRSPNPGAEGVRPVAALSPLPALPPRGRFPARGGVPRGGAPGFSWWGPGRPSHGATALPPRPRLLLPPFPGCGEGHGAGRGGADCPQCAPGGSRRRARGVGFFGPRPRRHERSERTGSAAMSATHPTRLETRTKESNTCASQGLARKPPWRNEGEGRRSPAAEVGSRGLSESAEGAPPARLARRAGEVEHERTC